MTDLREQLQATLDGAYTIERELGGGGMSRVFVATENALGRRATDGYAGIGDNDHAMEWLETGFRKKTWTLRAIMNWDAPWLRSLHDDPRFIALKRRVLATTFKS